MVPAPPSTPPAVPRERLIELTVRARTRRIVVVGDVMLDRYLLGDTERLSPEAPVPVVSVTESRSALGGAANVAANVIALGASCSLVGIVGDDQAGAMVRAELATQRIGDEFLQTFPGRPTTAKTRVLARGQQVVRIDEEVDDLLAGSDLEQVMSRALAALADADALLLQDYNKGVLVPPLIGALIREATQRGIPIVVDPKFRHFFDYAGATVFKPNRRELESALGAAADLTHLDALPASLSRLRVDNLLLTLGAEGMILVTRDHSTYHIPSLARAVYDVSGAGDTVTAWVGAMLAAGAAMSEAAVVANYAAGVEVTKSGVATVSPEEILAAHEERFDRIGKLRRGGVI